MQYINVSGQHDGHLKLIYCYMAIIVNKNLKKTQAYESIKNINDLNVYCYVKEASHKRLHTVWFQLHDILEKANF